MIYCGTLIISSFLSRTAFDPSCCYGCSNLDAELKTTHTQSRIFLIMARYCSLAVWGDDYRQFSESVRTDGVRLPLLAHLVKSWFRFHFIYDGLRAAEWTADSRARLVKFRAWLHGLQRSGFRGAYDAAAGLQVA